MKHDIKTMTYCKPGSAWDTWRKAGARWRKETCATTPGATIIAANAYASQGTGENERNARKRAFIEGASK